MTVVLALLTIYQLVDLMHGRITLESALGSGTKATFSIPFKKPEYRSGSAPLVDLGAIPDRLRSELSVSGCASDQKSGSGSPPPSPFVAPDGLKNHRKQPSEARPPLTPTVIDTETNLTEAERKKINVLVVEDNAINQQIALKTIKKLGFSVSAVWNGREALDYLLEPSTAEHPRPDVILMDVQMPVLDGYRATHLIRHHHPYSSLPGLKAVPIVAMTASAIQGDREKCQRAGMDDYLAKPVKGKTLEKMLVKWALKSKHNFRSESYSSNHTEHDSNCSHHGRSPSPPTQVLPLRSIDSSNDSLRNAAFADRSRLPGPESEGDRGMQRVEAEDKARALRDDKLITAAEKTNVRHTSPSVPRTMSPPTAALTEENVGKHVKEQLNADPTSPRQGPLGVQPSERLSSSSLEVEARPGSPVSTIGSLRGVEGRRPERKGISRNDSDWSERTVTAKMERHGS